MEFEGLAISVSSDVYEPAEDSFLLAKHAKVLKGRILEVGCGSGIVSLVNAKANPTNEALGADINPEAIRCAAANAKNNKIPNIKFMES
ncbi:MAG: class I SAM-dependent methyltransferase, partial [Desulfobulbaceae bacterium]|nr:class I SAM-dependent methyltransferase [Desulfobulbaceae bacterium]